MAMPFFSIFFKNTTKILLTPNFDSESPAFANLLLCAALEDGGFYISLPNQGPQGTLYGGFQFAGDIFEIVLKHRTWGPILFLEEVTLHLSKMPHTHTHPGI